MRVYDYSFLVMRVKSVFSLFDDHFIFVARGFLALLRQFNIVVVVLVVRLRVSFCFL